MGYKRKPRTYTLVFDTDDMAGLTVVLRGLNIGEWLRINGLSDADEETIPGLLDIFASKLVSWNLEEDDGKPVPATRDSVHAQDLDFIVTITTAWINAVSGVSGPLETTSTSGEPFPVGSIPVETLSPSPPLSSDPSGSSPSVVPSTFSPVAS